MAIKIITDSTSDLPKEMTDSLGVEVLPLKVLFGHDEYVDGIDLTNEEFYQKLENTEELPTTSQVTPEQYIKVFEQAKKDGDTIVGIHVSADMSGTIQSAIIAKEHVGFDDLHIVDSRTVSLALGQIVIEAARVQQAGGSLEDILAKANDYVNKSALLGSIATLKYLKKGGRIKASSAAIGNALNIRPIVTIKDGIVESIAKARGQKKAFIEIKKLISDMTDTLDGKEMYIAHSYDEEQFVQFKAYMLELYKPSNIIESKIGSVVGTHAGPGCVMVAFAK